MAAKRCCTLRVSALIVLLFGIFFLVVGLIAKPVIHKLMENDIKDAIPLKDSSASLFDLWAGKETTPMFMIFYVYNVTNAVDIAKHGAKPILDLVGPFSYTEYRQKDNITWPTPETISFTYRRFFTPITTPCNGQPLNPPDFVCSLDDSMLMTALNVPLMGVYTQLSGLNVSDAIKKAISDLLLIPGNETLFKPLTAREVIYGYDDKLLELLNKIGKTFDIPELMQDPHYQLQYNDSTSEMQNKSIVYSGVNNLNQVTSYIQWAGRYHSLTNTTETVGKWAGCDDTPEGLAYRAQANMINGSDGIQFPPLLDDDQVLPVYTEDLFRSANLVHTEDVSYRGVHLFRYKISNTSLQNATEYPPACAFDNYGPTGVLNMTRAVVAPVFASKPSYLDADPIYGKLVDGVPPFSRDDDDTYLDIDPWTGSVMRAHQRLQINVLVNYSADMAHLKKVSKTGFYLPIIKADEQGYISDHLLDQWNSQVGFALTVSEDAFLAGVVIGPTLIFTAFCLFVYSVYRTRHQEEEEKPLFKSVKTYLN